MVPDRRRSVYVRSLLIARIEDQGSRIEDRGSRIKDQGSRIIEDRSYTMTPYSIFYTLPSIFHPLFPIHTRHPGAMKDFLGRGWRRGYRKRRRGCLFRGGAGVKF